MKGIVLLATLLLLSTAVASASILPGAKVVKEYYADPYSINVSTMPALSDFTIDDPSDGIDWNFIPLPYPCVSGINGSTFIAVSKGSSNNILIYLEGGGACSDYFTCGMGKCVDHLSCSQSGATVTTLNPNPYVVNFYYKRGIFDRTNPLNPFKDWTIIFVPYSTGDIHWGNRVVQYCNPFNNSDCFTVHHTGFVNAATAIRWAAKQGDFDKVVIAGSSAGGYGTIIHFYTTREQFKKAVLAIDDAGPGITANASSRPMFTLEWVNYTWGAYQNLPRDSREFMTGKDPVYFVDYVLSKFKDSRFALFEDQYDYIIGTKFNGYTAEQFRELLLSKTCEIKAKHRHSFFRYFPLDSKHTVLAGGWDYLGYDRFYELSIHKYYVYEWIEDLLKGKKRDAIETDHIKGKGYLWHCPKGLFAK